MLSIKLKSGINTKHFQNKFKLNFEDLYYKKIEYYIKEDILIKINNNYILSDKGKLFANEVANNFVN